MRRSSSNSSLATARAPFEPATELDHVPVVFYEILVLATRGQAEAIRPLIQSVIRVTQSQPDSLVNLPQGDEATVFRARLELMATELSRYAYGKDSIGERWPQWGEAATAYAAICRALETAALSDQDAA